MIVDRSVPYIVGYLTQSSPDQAQTETFSYRVQCAVSANLLHVAHKFHATNDDGEGTHWQLDQGQQETSQGLARGRRSGIGQRQPAEGYGKLIFIPRQKEREGEGKEAGSRATPTDC